MKKTKNNSEKQTPNVSAATLEASNMPAKPPKNGQPLKWPKLTPDAEEMTKTPFSLRLKANVDQIIRLGANMAGVSMQEILNECIETKFEEVVARHIKNNKQAFEAMRQLFESVTKADQKAHDKATDHHVKT